MLFPKKIQALTLFSVVFLAACSSGGGGGDGAVTSASGRVIDGYIGGAKVCFDLNKNGKCDAGEPFCTTAADGSYTLSYAGSLDSTASIVVEIPAGAVDASDGVISLPYGLQSTLEYQKVVSPFTTLAKVQMDANPGLSMAQASAAINAKLGMNIDFTKDHIAQLDRPTQNAARALVAMIQNSKFNETKDVTSMNVMLDASKDVVKWAHDNVDKGYVDVLDKVSTVVSKANVVTKLATPGLSGQTGALVVDSAGVVYTLDSSTIYKLNSSGVSVPFASLGPNDGGFMAFDAEKKNLYVTAKTKVLKITPEGVVTDFAGNNVEGITNGSLSDSRFRFLISIAVRTDGKIYVIDAGLSDTQYKVRVIDPVTNVVSDFDTSIFNSITSTAYNPQHLAAGPNGQIFIIHDNFGFLVRQDSTFKFFTELTAASIGNFYYSGVAFDSSGSVYIFNSNAQKLLRLSDGAGFYEPITIAGGGAVSTGGVSGDQTKFTFDSSITAGLNGSVYVFDAAGPAIFKVK